MELVHDTLTHTRTFGARSNTARGRADAESFCQPQTDAKPEERNARNEKPFYPYTFRMYPSADSLCDSHSCFVFGSNFFFGFFSLSALCWCACERIMRIQLDTADRFKCIAHARRAPAQHPRIHTTPDTQFDGTLCVHTRAHERICGTVLHDCDSRQSSLFSSLSASASALEVRCQLGRSLSLSVRKLSLFGEENTLPTISRVDTEIAYTHLSPSLSLSVSRHIRLSAFPLQMATHPLSLSLGERDFSCFPLHHPQNSIRFHYGEYIPRWLLRKTFTFSVCLLSPGRESKESTNASRVCGTVFLLKR